MNTEELMASLRLTDEELRAINDAMPSEAKYGDVFKAIAEAQLLKVLSDPRILVRAESQVFPLIPDIPTWWGSISTYQEGQFSMARNDWVRVEKK